MPGPDDSLTSNQLLADALRTIAKGPPPTMANDEVAAWAAWIALSALTGTADEPTARTISHEPDCDWRERCTCGAREAAEKSAATHSEDDGMYDIEFAIGIAELWRSGKMIGGDADGVVFALLREVERLRTAMKPECTAVKTEGNR